MATHTKKPDQKLVLFMPLNAAGHVASNIAIANQLRQDHNYRCAFVLAGPPHSREIEDNGHVLVELEDLAPVYEYELEVKGDQEKKAEQEKEKRAFHGAQRWPPFMGRRQHLYKTKEPEKTYQCLADVYDMCSDYFIGNMHKVQEVIGELQPDLIITDTPVVLPDTIKSERTRPWIKIYTANPIALFESKLASSVKPPPYLGTQLMSKEKRLRMKEEDPQGWQKMLDEWARINSEYSSRMSAVAKRVRDFYQSNDCGHRLASDMNNFRVNSPHVNIYTYPEALDYTQDDDLLELPAGWMRCESLLRKSSGKREQAEQALWRRKIEEKMKSGGFKTIIYFSLGSIASGDPALMQRYINYLSSDQGSERLYIVSKGVNGDKFQLDERNMLGGNYLPQNFLLQLANLAIIHGGNNSTIECMYYGKPVIIMPSFFDQLDNGQRVEDLGVGKYLDLYACTRAELLSSIESLSRDTKLAERMEEIGKKIRSRDELAKVSEVVKCLVEGKRASEALARKYGIKL